MTKNIKTVEYCQVCGEFGYGIDDRECAPCSADDLHWAINYPYKSRFFDDVDPDSDDWEELLKALRAEYYATRDVLKSAYVFDWGSASYSLKA